MGVSRQALTETATGRVPPAEMDMSVVHSHTTAMETIAAAEFKQKCLQILDEVGPEGITITKRGKPVARLVPFRRTHGHLIGSMRGEIILNPDADLLSSGEWPEEQ